jgi:hypothetical protein
LGVYYKTKSLAISLQLTSAVMSFIVLLKRYLKLREDRLSDSRPWEEKLFEKMGRENLITHVKKQRRVVLFSKICSFVFIVLSIILSFKHFGIGSCLLLACGIFFWITANALKKEADKLNDFAQTH